MEFFAIVFFIFVGLALLWSLLFAVIGPVWLLRVARRSQANATRLAELERINAQLRAALSQQEAAEARPAASPPPSAAPAPSAAPVAAASEPIATEPAVPVVEAEPAAEAEPVASPPVPPEQPAPPSPPRRGDWERWIGVRGAAVVGGAVLALAGFLFLKFSIEQGLIPPAVRVALGVLTGVACLVGSEALRRRRDDYRATANALAGAGVVLLYAAVWAARVLYSLIGGGAAFVLMALVTVACGVLSWRYRSTVIAVLGLVGGFATPVLLSTGQDRPVGLFGYLLLLDVGVLLLAARRRWPGLAAFSLGLTVCYQMFWIFTRMGADRLLLGLAIVALFAGVFALAGRLASPAAEKEPSLWLLIQAAAVLLPFTFALYFAGRAELGPHLYPTAALLLLLTLLALWVGNDRRQPLFAVAAAAGDVAVVAVWCLATRLDTPLIWEGVASGLVLALACHLGAERGFVGAARAAGLAAGGLLLLFILVPLDPDPTALAFWPWLVGWLGLAALLCRQSIWEGQGWRQLFAAVGVGLGLGLFFLAHSTFSYGSFPAGLILFCGLGAAVAFQLLALGRGTGLALGTVLAGPRAEQAAAALPATVLAAIVLTPWSASRPASAGLFLGAALALALLVVLAATRLRSGAWYFAATALLATAHGVWSDAVPRLPDAAEAALTGLGIQVFAVVLLTAWPFLAGQSFATERWAWYAAALAGPAWFLGLKTLFVTRFGDAAVGVVPVALAALTLAAAFRARRLWRPQDALSQSRLVWLAAVTLGFASVAIPLQLEKEWITLGWALEGFAVTVLWKRFDHPGLKYFGLALLAAATVRLVANPALVEYYPRGGWPLAGWPIVNWLLYTYLVPAAALIATARLLGPLEVARRRRWEQAIYAAGRPVGAIACGLAAIAVVFVWINLEIFDFFSSGPGLEVSFARLAARDLTMSLAWIGYALVLLALGMARASRGLRWISLAFLVLAIGKVFLYDLGELEDLYRVAALVGLAGSLLVVSLAYQRFVFGRRPAEGAQAAEVKDE